MNRPALRQQASLQTTLTPRLQQSVHLLQLTSSEFAQELDEAIVNNPFLEGSAIQCSEPRGATESPVDAPTTLVASSFDEPPAAFRGAATDGTSMAGRPTGSDDIGASLAAEVDLRQYLARELGTRRLSNRMHALARLVIESLDDDGYLRQSLAEVAENFAFEPAIGDNELLEALAVVQQLGPTGVAARSVSECIRLQLEADHRGANRHDGTRSLAIAIANDHLNLVARRDWTGLARHHGVAVAEVEAAVQMIRAVDPRPGRVLGERTADAIVPDIIVRRGAKGWIVETNPALIPRASINERYAELFHRATLENRQPLAEQLQEARWLLRNMAQRFITIRRVAESIVAEQAAFLEFGDIALKPLALRAIADRLELHESTISRATQGKYMATPRGVFEFRRFFSRDLPTVTGGRASTASIRAGLRELIEREEKCRPWSDVDLARLLTEQGLCVARRTVSKYRSQMRIPSTEMRGE